MLFFHPWMLLGLVAVTIPIIIHLMRRQAAKPMDWGAMRFLMDTISVRRRRMEWEDLLLMAARCLLLALVALAIARPFLTPDSQVPWMFVLPAALLGVALAGASFVLSGKRARLLTRGLAVLLCLVALSLGYWEKIFNLRRFEASGRRDVALVIDASASMELMRGGKTVFQLAVEEAKAVVSEAPRGTAFLVVLGGPSPQAMTASPLTHRADVLGVLDGLTPMGGSFRAHEALGVATLALAQGTNTTKEMIVFTDSQRSGWRLDEPDAWDRLDKAWDGLPTQPKLLVRNFGEPNALVNVALRSFATSRTVVGTDRDVTLRAEVINTGVNVVTPGAVTFLVDQKKVGTAAVGLLMPGQSTWVELRHRFAKVGLHVVSASVEATDDLSVDNRWEMVMNVQEQLPVLLIDGNPTGSFFERASGYTALALAPGTAILQGKTAGERYLMDPRVVPAAQVKSEDLEQARVIVLADVPRLPERLAALIAARVTSGAGLIVIAGPRSEPGFYNPWSSLDGPLLPMELGEEKIDVKGVSPAPATFVHESMALFQKRSDLADAVVKRWRAVGQTREHGVLAAAYGNGDAFLATQLYGSGRVMLSTCAFDARAGNFPARQSFLPFIHEWVSWAAGGGMNWNVAALWSPSVALDQAGGGLTGYYERSNEKNSKVLLQRTDATVDFDWTNQSPGKNVPRDQYIVTWKATLVPPVTGDYKFEAEVNESLRMNVGDGPVWQADAEDHELGLVALEAGKSVPVDLRYEQEWGAAYVRLYWKAPGGKRELIPRMAWIPEVEEREPMRVVDPRGLPREATILAGRRGRELKIDGSAMPGIYQVYADELLEELSGVKKGEVLPVAVLRDPEESVFTSMNEDDKALMASHVDLLWPQSTADVLAVLQGKGFGREIARWLALAAAAFFVLECVLARWVSKSRRAGEEVRVEFGDDTIWRGGLR